MNEIIVSFVRAQLWEHHQYYRFQLKEFVFLLSGASEYFIKVTTSSVKPFNAVEAERGKLEFLKPCRIYLCYI